MYGMTQSLWAIINVWRKMEAAKVAAPEGYLPLLYADEIKWKLVLGKTINALSASRMEEKYVF